ncbi:MAG: metallophosphoesterase [Balneolales bacterium]
MKTIAHISDLHFGREDPVVARGLVADIQRLRPNLVVNSGDFTQRARQKQFRAAANFVKQLPQPQINIPGNHDIPLFDVARRFLKPLDRYKAFITEDLFPTYVDDEIAVLGINTARSLTWKSGRISIEQIDEIERILSSLPNSLFKVLVTHHPFIPPPGEENVGVDLVGRAVRALEVIDRNNVDLLLAGHLHHGYTGDIRTFYPTSKRSVIVAQAGTAISNRVRNEPNGYNYIRATQTKIEIELRKWHKKAFINAGKAVFLMKNNQWIPEPGSTSI